MQMSVCNERKLKDLCVQREDTFLEIDRKLRGFGDLHI